MKTQIQYNMMDAVYRSKLFIESWYSDLKLRKWYKTIPLDSFKDENNRVELYVYEGAPPRGFIIANYRLCTVKAFDMDMQHRMTTCVSELELPDR